MTLLASIIMKDPAKRHPSDNKNMIGITAFASTTGCHDGNLCCLNAELSGRFGFGFFEFTQNIPALIQKPLIG